MVVVGRLRDSRPWADDTRSIATVHDMELRVTVRVEDLTITEATADMLAPFERHGTRIIRV